MTTDETEAATIVRDLAIDRLRKLISSLEDGTLIATSMNETREKARDKNGVTMYPTGRDRFTIVVESPKLVLDHYTLGGTVEK